MPTRIVFTGKQALALHQYNVPTPGPGQVLTRTRYSLMSTGTENIVFNRNFDPGTNWDKWVKYPFHAGYLNVGVVEAVGPGVTGWSVGDVAVSRAGHGSHELLDVSEVRVNKLPAGIDQKNATWFGLAKIASMGARVAGFELGQSVAIVGAGPVGQMATRWAAAAGVGRLVVIDPVQMRLDMARKGGATATISLPAGEASDALKSACDGMLPAVLIDTTGHPAVFAAALPLIADFGRLVLLGDAGSPSQQRLTGDVINRGLTIVGAHDIHESPLWDSRQSFAAFSHLVLAGRFNLDGLITHTFKPEQAADAYRIANEKRAETMGILFDWT